MRQAKNLKGYRREVDTALSNQFLREAMDKFAVAYRTSRQNAFAGMDVDSLVADVALGVGVDRILPRPAEEGQRLVKFGAAARHVHIHKGLHGRLRLEGSPFHRQGGCVRKIIFDQQVDNRSMPRNGYFLGDCFTALHANVLPPDFRRQPFTPEFVLHLALGI